MQVLIMWRTFSFNFLFILNCSLTSCQYKAMLRTDVLLSISLWNPCYIFHPWMSRKLKKKHYFFFYNITVTFDGFKESFYII